MIRISKTARQMFLISAAICAAVALAALFLPRWRVDMLIGVALGFCATALKLLMLDRAIDNALDKQGGVQAGMALSYILRFAVTAAALAAAVIHSPVSFYAAAAGVLAMPASAYITRAAFKADYADNPAGYKSPEEIDELMGKEPVGKELFEKELIGKGKGDSTDGI